MRSYRGFLRHVLAQAPQPKSERIAVTAATGRLLLDDVKARVTDPAERRSAMDGYAVRSRDLQSATALKPVRLVQTGRTGAGAAPRMRIGSLETCRIMTGAPVPSGADAVVPVENVSVESDQVLFRAAPPAGAHIRMRGENFRRGGVVVRAGSVLRPQEAALCITAGVTKVRVARRLRVGILTTGSELVEPGTKLRRGEVFDSNGPMLTMLVHQTGAEAVALGRIPDRVKDLQRLVMDLRGKIDLLITVGGVSMGDFDIVKAFLRTRRGVELVRVRMRPAKPQAFGRLGRMFWYALPGNPVSAFVAFDRFVRPLILRSMGHRPVFRTPRVGSAVGEWRKKHDLIEFVRAHASETNEGWNVRRVGPEGSANLRSVVNANAFAILHEEEHRIKAGAPLTFELFADPPTRSKP